MFYLKKEHLTMESVKLGKLKIEKGEVKLTSKLKKNLYHYFINRINDINRFINEKTVAENSATIEFSTNKIGNNYFDILNGTIKDKDGKEIGLINSFIQHASENGCLYNMYYKVKESMILAEVPAYSLFIYNNSDYSKSCIGVKLNCGIVDILHNKNFYEYVAERDDRYRTKNGKLNYNKILKETKVTIIELK